MASNGTYHGDDVVTANTRTHAGTAELLADVAEIDGGASREIRDGSALAIASGWQSPGGTGRWFAQLASTGTVRLEDLCDALSDAWDEARRVYGSGSAESRQLDLLATWAVNHPSR